jgi:hypothetical protein
VSKADPRVSIVIVPACGARQENQTERPPALPAWFGSPASFVAPLVGIPSSWLSVRKARGEEKASLRGVVGTGTVQTTAAGLGSRRPAASSARTAKVCSPGASSL